MKVSEKQLLCLYQIASDTVSIEGGEAFRLDRETRRKLVEDILNSQDTELREVKDDE